MMTKILSFLLASFLTASPLFADATIAARERNFVNDKANSIPITASYMDGEFDNIINKLNAKVRAAASAPSSPSAGDTWVDTSITPAHLKVYDGTAWTSPCGKGADVASAATTTLGAAGCFFDITGTTTITSVTAKPAGFTAILQFDGALTFTDGSNLKLNGNFTTAADSTIALISDGTNWYEIARQPGATFASAAEVLTGTEAAKSIAPSTMVSHQGVIKAWANFNGTGTPAYNDQFNFTGSITDNGTGDYTLTIDTDFGGVNYACAGSAQDAATEGLMVTLGSGGAGIAAGSLRLRLQQHDGVAEDDSVINIICIGDR